MDVDALIADYKARFNAATTEEERIAALSGAMAADTMRAIEADRQLRAADAAIVDADPAAFPMDPWPTIVRAARHIIALSGFSAAELDDLFKCQAGTFDLLRSGGEPERYYLGYDFTDFITVCRQVALTFPGQPVRDWWLTARHGKRLSPLDLAKAGRIRERIFAPYRAELHCNGQVVSQLLPTVGSNQFVELELSFA